MKNLGLRSGTVSSVNACIGMGMSLLASIKNKIETIYFNVQVLEMIVGGTLRTDVNTLVLYIPQFNDAGVDISMHIKRRYKTENALRFETVDGQPHTYRFTAPISTRLNLYQPSQSRNTGSVGGSGGYIDDICFRANSSKGEGSHKPDDKSLVLHMPSQDVQNRFIVRQDKIIRWLKAQQRVRLVFVHEQDQIALHALITGYDSNKNLFAFDMDALEAIVTGIRPIACENQTEQSDQIIVSGTTTFQAMCIGALSHEDKTGMLLLVFRCMLFGGDSPDCPVTVSVYAC